MFGGPGVEGEKYAAEAEVAFFQEMPVLRKKAEFFLTLEILRRKK
jgi:hypothetical protein